MKRLEFLFGIFILLTAFVLAVGLDRIIDYFDLPSFMCVGLFLTGYVFIGPGISKSVDAVRIIFTEKATSAGNAKEAEGVFKNAVFAVIISGVLFTLVGVINMCTQGMDDRNTQMAGFARALLTISHSLVLAFIFTCCKTRAAMLVSSFEANEA